MKLLSGARAHSRLFRAWYIEDLDHNRSMQLILNSGSAKPDIRTFRANFLSSLIFVCAGQEDAGRG